MVNEKYSQPHSYCQTYTQAYVIKNQNHLVQITFVLLIQSIQKYLENLFGS